MLLLILEQMQKAAGVRGEGSYVPVKLDSRLFGISRVGPQVCPSAEGSQLLGTYGE